MFKKKIFNIIKIGYKSLLSITKKKTNRNNKQNQITDSCPLSAGGRMGSYNDVFDS